MGLRVAELFAGVGGFHVGLKKADQSHKVVWSNQWEPGKRVQWASECYQARFPRTPHVNGDIALVDCGDIPDHDLLVGGFPCQDYSVAATLDRSGGIEGKKGVLWWQIERILREKRPPYVLLENVDRLLRSPASQRGRDFGILLWCMQNLGYRVEWRILNAADYGFPQRRRRIFIFGAHRDSDWGQVMEGGASGAHYLSREGFFGREFAVVDDQVTLDGVRDRDVVLPTGLKNTSDGFAYEFQNAGVCVNRSVWTRKLKPKAESIATLRSVLERDVSEEYYVPEGLIPKWRYYKGAKRQYRVSKKNGHKYFYSEGAIPFPDRLDQPSRTILTGEGGTGPSRLKHLIEDPETGRLRVLTPVECEKLNGFRPDWTVDMPQRWRYFTMGNALVVGLVERMCSVLAISPEQTRRRKSTVVATRRK